MSDEKSKGPHLVNIALRIVAMALSVAAAALMATASECAIYYGATPTLHVVTYKDFSPFVYLMVANAVAACLGAAAIFLSVWKKGPRVMCNLLLPFLDAAVPALLYSSAGAAFAAGDVTYCAAPYGRRVSVCAAAGSGNFCSQVHLSIYIALAASVAVSAAAVAVHLSLGKGKSSDSGSESESDTCGHGCHSKH